MLKACDKTLCQTNDLPDVGMVVETFLQRLRIGIVQKTTIAGRTQEVPVWRSVMGSCQPMSENLAVRKEGERSWRWYVFHFEPDVCLETDDVIIFQGTKYRIMEKENWGQYGFIRYNAVEDYTPAGAQ